MKVWLLTVFFITLDGDKVILDGWHPIEVPTLERCEKGKQNIEEFIDAVILDGGLSEFTDYEVTCEEKV